MSAMPAALTPAGTRLSALAVAGLLTVGLAGCSGSPTASDAGSGGGDSAPAVATREADAPADGVSLAFGADGSTTARVKPGGSGGSGRVVERIDDFLGRDVIATAQVTVRTTDVSKARDEVGDLLRRYVGYVAEERTERDRDGDTVRSVLRLRVPTPKFDAALADLEELAPQVDVDRTTEDVTQQVVDVASRIRTQEISLGRLRRFLDRATTVDDVVRLESEIARREGDLGSMRAQQRELRDLTSESTITVRLQHVKAEKAEKPDPEEAGFVAGLSTGWGAFTAAVVGLSQAAGVALPFAVVLGLVGVPLVMWLRRRRTRLAPVAASGPVEG